MDVCVSRIERMLESWLRIGSERVNGCKLDAQRGMK